jgi:hypothetical protein
MKEVIADRDGDDRGLHDLGWNRGVPAWPSTRSTKQS